MTELIRVLLGALALYVLAVGIVKTRSTWAATPAEHRLLWMVLLSTNATLLLANITGVIDAQPLRPATYLSTVPLLLGVALVSLPRRYRA